MANGKNENTANAPKKKADVIIEANKEIAGRLETAITIFDKGTKDNSDVLKKTVEMFDEIKKENENLKNEIKYLYAQFTGIFETIDDKISELNNLTSKPVVAPEGDRTGVEVNVVTPEAQTSSVPEDLVERLEALYANLTEQAKRNEEAYAALSDKLQETAEQNRRTEETYLDLFEKVNTLSEQTARSETAYMELTDKFTSGVYETSSVAVAATDMKTFEKIDELSDQIKRMDNAHSMLADKFEILSMRIEQFAMEASNKAAPSSVSSTAVVPYPAPSGEIDYDELAKKIGELFLQEVYSPDYIASRVAEQIVIPTMNPEVKLEDMQLDIDTAELARQVADRVNRNAENSTVNIDEDSLVEKIAQRLAEVQPAPAPVVVSEPVAAVGYDEDELADKIALKVGSLKPEDFEILVDDGGCESISKQIIGGLDYKAISDSIAEQLREVLELNAANAPDYEDLAERISSNITVAGINEDAIADKAAAALSNYLPDFDTDEIVDKVTGAVLDVVSAMPQATIDSDAMCTTICENVTEKVLEAQAQSNDYDIVIDEEGLSRITEEIKSGTDIRFNKVDEDIEELKKTVAALAPSEDAPVATEIKERFDRVDEELNKINELLSNDGLEDFVAPEAVIPEDVTDDLKHINEKCERLEELIANLNANIQNIRLSSDDAEEEAYELSETIAEDLQKVGGTRFDRLQEDIEKLTDTIAEEPKKVKEEEKESANSEYAAKIAELEEKLAQLTKAITEQNEKERDSESDARFAKVEEELEKLTDIINAQKAYDEEEYPFLEEEADKEATERFGRIEEELAKLTQLLESRAVNENPVQDEKIGELLAGKVEETTATRFDKVEDEISQIKALLAENLAAATAAAEAAASNLALKEEEPVEEVIKEQPVDEESELVKVSDLFDGTEDDGDFSLDDADTSEADASVLLKDNDDELDDDELMPGQTVDGMAGVDFENMMKYKRSFIARIIQSTDDKKNYYGAIKHAMLSYKKVNSNVAWGAERFNKGRETIARIKMRGKTLVLYLALDPNNYKTSVYHHLDATDNRSVSGTPMMVKIRSPLGVKKAIRLIDEMLAMRGAEKREILERDYAAMYPYETIEELIDDGLVKDVRKDK